MAWYNKIFSKQAFKGAGKAALIATGIAAGVAAIGAIARGSRNERREATRNTLSQLDAPDLPTPEIPGPAEGYAPGQWQNYVQAGRAGASQVRSGNPRMIVGDAEELGAPRSLS